MEGKLLIADSNMLLLIGMLKTTGHIRFQQDFCDAIGMLKQNIRNVKNGSQHFTAEHIRLACEVYNVNANWILGIEQSQMFRAKIHHLPLPKSLPKNLKTKYVRI